MSLIRPVLFNAAEKRVRKKGSGKKGQSTSLSQPIFFSFVLGMRVASPQKNGFYKDVFSSDLALAWEQFNDRKLVVAFRALMFRPLQTGVTRHRFCAETQPCQSTFEQCLPLKGDGAARLQSDPSHRLRVTVRMSHPGVSAVKSFSATAT